MLYKCYGIVLYTVHAELDVGSIFKIQPNPIHQLCNPCNPTKSTMMT